MNRFVTLSLLTLVLLSGCASYRPPTQEFDALAPADRANGTKESRDALQRDFGETLKVCDTQIAAMRNAFTGSGNTELALGGIGIVAGSIIVPALAAKAAAAKSTVAAWGGVSGAANAAQLMFNQKGASAAAVAELHNGLQSRIESLAKDFAAKRDNNADASRIVNELMVACRYPRLPQIQPAQTPATPAAAPAPAPATQPGATT